jgi:hypothetical protein
VAEASRLCPKPVAATAHGPHDSDAGATGDDASAVASTQPDVDGDVLFEMIVRKVYRATTFGPPDRVDAVLDGIMREVPLEYGRYDRSARWSAVGMGRRVRASATRVRAGGASRRVECRRLHGRDRRGVGLIGRAPAHVGCEFLA